LESRAFITESSVITHSKRDVLFSSSERGSELVPLKEDPFGGSLTTVVTTECPTTRVIYIHRKWRASALPTMDGLLVALLTQLTWKR
tara:strand:- start:156 stop:416 length:261 start_codon:yes stop_codon:yes gene_type:complete